MKRLMILLTMSVSLALAGLPCRGLDMDAFRSAFGSREWDAGWNRSCDLNADGIIDGSDLAWGLLDPAAANAHDVRPALFRMDHVLVKFTVNEDVKAMNEILGKYRSRIVQSGSDAGTGYFRAEVPVGTSVPEFVRLLKENPRVAEAQADYICSASTVPNDKYYHYQWNFPAIGAEKAWDLSQGGDPDIIVAILDTGIAYENYGDYIQASDLADTRFVKGYDYINSDDHANDDEGHGTHVAGTVAQSTNNNLGAAGIAYRCTLMPVKILDADGNGSSDTLSKGLHFAADNGAAVVNLSLGFPVGVDGGPAVREAVTYAVSKGVICVGAAGNEAGGRHYNGGIDYPAALPGCIAVGATRVDGNRTYYSNWGPELDCVAPGGNIDLDQNHDGQPDGILQQAFINGNYTKMMFYYFQGTSMATPHVSAAAALFKARRGGNLPEFRDALAETCRDRGETGKDEMTGYGLIDLEAIVRKGKGWGADGW